MADPINDNPLGPLFSSAAGEAGRRDFFTEAFREAMGPLSNMLERKVNPLLRALEDIPAQIDAMVGPVDQPQSTEKRRIVLPVAPARERIIRPPGSLPRDDFESTCSKCGKCVEVCPANAIKIDASGYLAGGFPYIIPEDRPCVVCEELACMKECPSGALKLVDRLRIRIGTAKVDHETCLRHSGEDCRLCVQACPVAEQAIHVSPETNRVRVKKRGCLGCGLCENACPTAPRAIKVFPPNSANDIIIA
jgi:ferredoxin-type protein NapG